MYSMVKAGMNSFARTIAAEERDIGVGVWAIRLGNVDVSGCTFPSAKFRSPLLHSFGADFVADAIIRLA